MFLSTASVVLILACVAVLVVASALTLAPLEGQARWRGVAFAFCLVVIWALAFLVVALIKRSI